MDFDVAASKIERYDAVNNRLLQTLDADPLMVDDPENTLACSLLETIPEFSYDDADLILDVVEQYLRLIDGDEETKRKIIRRYATVIVEDLRQQIYASKEEHTEFIYNVQQDLIVFGSFAKTKLKHVDGKLGYKKEIADKKNIKNYLFEGYRKSYYPVNSFDSDDERRFQLASKIKNIFDLPYCVNEKDGNKVWPVLFQGRKAGGVEPGNFVWRLRPELFEALKEFGIERYLEEGEEEVPELSIKESMELIKEYIASKGFSYDGELIENFYLSLKSKPFVILAGTSGTGKTRLVRLFAEAIGANYKLVSVRPDWSDSSDLFGHVNLKGEFVPGAIIDYIHEAAKPENINIPYFLCLDEMNLARVEYYLSDFLSIIETRHREDGRVVTDEIILDKAVSVTYGKVILPENLYVIGTVNMDETTFPFSKKVLDRANTIEFSYVDLVPDFSESLEEAEAQNCKNDFLKTDYITLMSDTATEDRQFVSDICFELQEINEILQCAQAHVGYRVRDEIIFYMLNNKKAELLDTNLAFDNEIMQKILPRIQGSSASIKDMLCELFKKCAGDYTGLSQASVSEQMQVYVETKDCKYKKSAEKICYMMRRFEEDGFTSYWL